MNKNRSRPKKPDVNETAFAVVMAAIGEHPPTPDTAPIPPASEAKPKRKTGKAKSPPKKPA